MDSDPKLAKAQIRSKIKVEIRRISPDERLRLSVQACALIKQQQVWIQARSVLLYAPLKDELDVSLLLPDAAAQQKLISFPQFNLDRGQYIACCVEGASQALVRGKHGILEPPADSPVMPLNQLDLVLVPGVAFDLHGRRLGRGFGHYDRLLENIRGFKCGVGFDQQIRAELPEEPHDARLDCILTPTRWLSFSRRAVLK